MIDKALLIKTVEEALEGSDMFIVDVKVTPENDLTVEIDSMSHVDIDTCASLTRQIEKVFDRDVEDYRLEVGSAGLTSPLKVRQQYVKNIGNDVEVLTRDGRKLRGKLTGVSDDGSSFTIESMVKVKNPGEKRPHLEAVSETMEVAACKSVVYDLQFK